MEGKKIFYEIDVDFENRGDQGLSKIIHTI